MREAYIEWEQKTLEQGRLEGRLEGISGIVIRQLHRRFGEIQPGLMARIRSLSAEELELLSEALLDFSSITELEQWLHN